MSDLTRQTQERQAAQQQQLSRGDELTKTVLGTRNAISAALAQRVDPDQFLRALATEIRKTPHLDECLPETVLGGLFTAAQMGLEIGAHRGLAYLVPYRNSKTNQYEASLIIGYKGFVELFYRAGARSVQWLLVREGDVFRIGSDAVHGKIYHWEQADPNSRKPITGAVAQVVTATGGIVWEYLSAADIAKRHTETPFWKKWPDEMSLKTVLRRLVATAPQSTDLRRAAEVDETVLRRVPGEEQPVARRLPDARPAQLQATPQPRPDGHTRVPGDQASRDDEGRPKQERPKPHPPKQQAPAEPPVEDDQRSQYAVEEPTPEQWAEIERQQYEDAMRQEEEQR